MIEKLVWGNNREVFGLEVGKQADLIRLRRDDILRRSQGAGVRQLGGTPMQFLIHGADQKTGREMTIVVDARDQTEAEQRVLYNDILIGSMAKFVSPPPKPPRAGPLVPYQRPEPKPEEREKGTRTPIYQEILSGAKWLGGLAAWTNLRPRHEQHC